MRCVDCIFYDIARLKQGDIGAWLCYVLLEVVIAELRVPCWDPVVDIPCGSKACCRCTQAPLGTRRSWKKLIGEAELGTDLLGRAQLLGVLFWQDIIFPENGVTQISGVWYGSLSPQGHPLPIRGRFSSIE